MAVEVGAPIAETFNVHLKVLCSSSDFLKAKVKPEWLKNQNSVKLPDLLPETFSIYVNWLYTGALTGLLRPGDAEDRKDLLEFRRLATAFVLGEALLDVAFKDTIIDTLLFRVCSDTGRQVFTAGAEIAKIVYDGTPTESPARQLLIDIYRNHAYEPDMTHVGRDLPHEFLLDVAVALVGKGKPQPLKQLQEKGTCDYHSHGSNVACDSRAK